MRRGMDLTGLALVISAILGPVSAVVIALTVNRNVRQVGDVVREIDRAVNGKDPMASTISQDVTAIMAKQERDKPTAGPDGAAALLPLVRYLVTQVDDLKQRFAE